VLNSFGHAVPVVAGQLHGREPKLAAWSSPRISPRLPTHSRSTAPGLRSGGFEKLERTFVFSEASRHRSKCATKLNLPRRKILNPRFITWGKIRSISENELEIADGEDAVRVTIDTQGRAFHLKQETIDEKVSSQRQPVRLGIALDAKVSTATVTLRIAPLSK